MIARLAVILCLIVAPALADPVDGSRIVVIDGDTVALPCARPSRGCAEKVRMLNIDAPETRGARCEGELALGLMAKDGLAARLRGRPVTIERCERAGRCRDVYGRTLARFITPEGDVGEAMIRAGLALPWRAGPGARAERRAYWCGP